MSSPFNPLSGLTPAFPTPSGLPPVLPGLSPAPVHPFLQSPSGASPFLPQAGGGGATPWFAQLGLPSSVPAGAGSTPSIPLAMLHPGGSAQQLQQGGQGGSGVGTGAGAQADADDALRAIPEMTRLLERAEAVRGEMGVLERDMFGKGEGAERQGGGLSRLEALQLDYAQTLLALIQLSSAYLVGALPVPLWTAIPTTASASATAPVPGDATSTATPAQVPSASDLAAWTEARAQAQFARREAVKNASKAVVDVLKGSRQ